MPKPSKKVVEKTPGTRPFERPLRLRPRPPQIFLRRSARWMLAASGATAPFSNLPRIIPGTKAPFRSALTRHKPCLLIALSLPRPRNLARTTKKVGAIGIVAIAALTAVGLRASPRPLGSTQPRLRLKTIVIVAATGQYKIETWAKPPITMVTRKSILLTNVLSPASQKTSISLGNLLVGDWC